MMEPMTVAGAIAGVLLNKVLPGWLITVCAPAGRTLLSARAEVVHMRRGQHA